MMCSMSRRMLSVGARVVPSKFDATHRTGILYTHGSYLSAYMEAARPKHGRALGSLNMLVMGFSNHGENGISNSSVTPAQRIFLILKG